MTKAQARLLLQAANELQAIERELIAEAWDKPSSVHETGARAQDYGRTAEAANAARQALERFEAVVEVHLQDKAFKLVQAEAELEAAHD